MLEAGVHYKTLINWDYFGTGWEEDLSFVLSHKIHQDYMTCSSVWVIYCVKLNRPKTFDRISRYWFISIGLLYLFYEKIIIKFVLTETPDCSIYFKTF